MNADKHMNKAKDLAKDGGAYIHCEVKNGETELVVSGDAKAITYGVYRTLKRLNEITGLPFVVMVGALEELYQVETGEELKEV